MNEDIAHRLEGLEPDNLLAFLALLGLLRSLERKDKELAENEKLQPRVAWDLDRLPVRPVLNLAKAMSKEQVAQAAADGVGRLVEAHDFDGQKDLVYGQADARRLLTGAIDDSSSEDRYRTELLAALMADGAVKQSKNETVIEPTPLCLMFGQGHQHFLQRLAEVPSNPVPPSRGRRKGAVALSAGECIAEALFSPWHRNDPTFSFRWDPEEDVRYALLPGDPTAPANKAGTQHGANRLAAVGLSQLTVAPTSSGPKVRLCILGGQRRRGGKFSFAWPIWQSPITLCAIRALLTHPNLRSSTDLRSLGVDHVLVAQRIHVGKFMNFGRGRRLAEGSS